MKSSSLTLIPSTSFGTANENYDPNDSDTFSGIPQKAAAYYSKAKSLQTLAWHLTNFTGVLTIEATLDGSSDTSNYFTIHTVNGTALYEDDVINLTGKYTWIRATITGFALGDINKITVGY